MRKSRGGVSAVLGCGVMIWVALSSSGCAIGTTRLAVAHAPLNPIPRQMQGNVVVRPFVDARPQKDFIGNKRNGFGMVLGHVATYKEVSLDALLTLYFVEALQQAGYTAVLDTSPAGSQAPLTQYDAVIQGEIVEFWMDLYMMVWHRVGVKVTAVNPADNQILWERLVEGAEKRTLWVGATGEFERVMREALTIALNRAAEAFASDDFFERVITKKK